MSRCPCGRPLHYRDRQIALTVARFVEELGPTVPVTVGSRTWLVPRHFIALHGFKAAEAEQVARRYGFAEVTGQHG